ncbi:MAG: ribonuclease E/G [Crocinitomicaceae bacterium]|nr:ribonuclease E/G [Crocinitomicaceae bacterium]
MNKELIIDASSEEVRIALLEDKRLVELHNEKSDNQYSVGDLYLGRIKKIVPGLNAAFVDVGYEKDAFLHYLDLGPQLKSLKKYLTGIRKKKSKEKLLNSFTFEKDIEKDGKINDVLKQGQEIVVQIAKEPISTKGPRITCELSLAGRFLVLVPFSDRISISSRIRNKAEKVRLKSLIESIKPKNFGVIIRTVAESKKVAELDQDLKDLVSRWEGLHDSIQEAKPPQKILGELSKSAAFLRDMLNPSYNGIAINEKVLHEEIKAYLNTIAPEKVNILKYVNKPRIFDHFGIEKQIKSLFGRNVTMKSGAYLVIEHTEALHVIDVNSGNTAKKDKDQESNALRVNIESAQEIARQLKLRDMGGIIVVDFIDQRKAENRKALLNKMIEFMKDDKAKHHVLPPSKFGLVQITRQRVRPEMEIKTSETIPTADGSKEVRATILLIDDIENKLKQILASGHKKVSIHCHPFIRAYFQQHKYQWKWLRQNMKWIKITSSNSLPLVEYHFIDEKGENIKA